MPPPSPDPRESPGAVIWFTGLAASGKTTIAREVATKLEQIKVRYELIDGDEVRNFFGGDLGFSRAEREQNIRRIAFAAGLLARHGVLALVANIAPYETIRLWIRQRIPRFALIYLDASIDLCRERDFKGVYSGPGPIIGVHEPYDVPSSPDLRIDPRSESISEAAERVISLIKSKSWIP